MGYIEILLIALAMSVDAFSVAFGVGCRHNTPRHYFRLAWHFGLFQFLMPLLGAGLGTVLKSFMSNMEIIAAIILFVIAYKMVKDSLQADGKCDVKDPTKGMSLIALSLATSMDAFGVGVSLVVMDINIMFASVVIGIVCLVATAFGVYFGSLSTRFTGKYAGFLGAFVLAVIGIKFLVV